MGWVVIGTAGWLACLIVIALYRGRKPGEAERQLQVMSREYAAAKKLWRDEAERIEGAHHAQMRAIYDALIAFEVDEKYKDPVAVQVLLDGLRSKTMRRNRGY